MLYYDTIEVSQGIDINKTNALKECDIYHWWCFLDNEFTFQLYVMAYSNGCHNELMIHINSSDIANLNINGANYHCIIIGFKWKK